MALCTLVFASAARRGHPLSDVLACFRRCCHNPSHGASSTTTTTKSSSSSSSNEARWHAAWDERDDWSRTALHAPPQSASAPSPVLATISTPPRRQQQHQRCWQQPWLVYHRHHNRHLLQHRRRGSAEPGLQPIPTQPLSSACATPQAFTPRHQGCSRTTPATVPCNQPCLSLVVDRRPASRLHLWPAAGWHARMQPSRHAGSIHSIHSSSSSSNNSSVSNSDARPTSSWIARLPAGAQPYAALMRLDKPIGSWLLAWPGLWSIALAAPPGQFPDPWYCFLFSAGAVLLRGAGCTINDLWDRDIDRLVERTRSRPLAAGTVTPLQALLFLGVQLSLGLAILLQLNPYTQALGASSLALVVVYPLMKRVTDWPQAFLGATFNWGALMGWAAVRGGCDWGVLLPLYAAGICWTLVYDTVYAHQDVKDDAVVGVRSTARLFGARTKPILARFAAAQAALLLVAGQAAGCGALYQTGVALGAAHQAWQVMSVDLKDPPQCMATFVSNRTYGAILFAGIAADRLLCGGEP